MSASNFKGASAPPMFPPMPQNAGPSSPPAPPKRSDVEPGARTKLIDEAPEPPPRQDMMRNCSPGENRSRGNDYEKDTDNENRADPFNYNRYATIKTIGHGFLEAALLLSNAMQMRILILQKQRDSIWVATLSLVCISIVLQLISLFLLYLMCTSNIRKRDQQTKLERINIISTILIMLLTLINIVINLFMLTINTDSFLDTPSLEKLRNQP